MHTFSVLLSILENNFFIHISSEKFSAIFLIFFHKKIKLCKPANRTFDHPIKDLS